MAVNSLNFKGCTIYGRKWMHQRSESASDQQDGTCRKGDVRGHTGGLVQYSAGEVQDRDTFLSTLHVIKGNRQGAHSVKNVQESLFIRMTSTAL